MTDTEKQIIIEQVRENKLAYTQRNYKTVRMIWAELVNWNQIFTEAGLDALPDTENMPEQEQLLRKWIIEAFAARGEDRDEIDKALAQVKHDIISGNDE
jgi:hypothetical protein